MWAYGNLFLIANTLVQFVQGVGSSLLVAEFPFYLKNLKFMRVLSFLGAIGYLAFYLFSLVEWLWNILAGSKDDKSFLALLEDLFFSWHVIFHAPVAVTNLIIVVKEIQYEMYQVKRKKYSTDHGMEFYEENLGLGLSDIGSVLGKIADKLNPINWWNKL